MDTKMKSMISNVDHGDRVTALESGFSGLEDSMDQQKNAINSRMVSVKCQNRNLFDLIQTKIYFQNAMDSKMKTMISNVDHGDRVTSLMAEVALLKREDAQLKANFSELESEVDELKIEVIAVFICYFTFSILKKSSILYYRFL